MNMLPILLLSLMTCISQPDDESRFVHTVFFWLKAEVTEAQKAEFLVGLTELSKIEEIEKSYIGRPADTRRPVIDSSYGFSITFIFKNQADQDVYQAHADHLKFISRFSHLWERVVVYDAVTPRP